MGQVPACAAASKLVPCVPFISRLGAMSGSLSADVLRSPSGTPLPRLPHRRLLRSEVCQSGGRLVFVGDVHGCIDELHALLKEVKFQQGRDTLVLVGDLVNKGPASGAVIKLARSLQALCVRGNHDDELLEAYYRVGRFAKGLEKYKHDALFQVSHDDVRWLQEQPLSLTFPWIDVVVVHAGLVPDLPLEEQEFMTLTKVRNVQRRRSGNTATGGGSAADWVPLERGSDDGAADSVAWAAAWRGPQHVVFGHDARRRLQEHPYATGLDTACCYGVRLTALVADSDDFALRKIHALNAFRPYAKKDKG